MSFPKQSKPKNIMKELIEGKECRGHELLCHLLGQHKEDYTRHIVHLALASAVLGLAITTLTRVCRIHRDVKRLEKDLHK